MPSIPIDVIRAFVAVVESRGFTRAAEDLGRSQPTISLQVKRLEELIEAPLFEKAARFALTPVGSVCFDYGKRLLRLHDEMLDEAARLRAPEARLRIGMPGEFAARLTSKLDSLRRGAGGETGYEVVTGESEALALVFRQNGVDLAILVGADPTEPAVGRWRASLGWFAREADDRAPKPPKAVPLVVPPLGSALREAAVGALRSAGRPFEIACTSADFAVRCAAASAGLGVAPMIEGLTPDGVGRSADPSLPALPRLVVSLLSRSEALGAAAARWAAEALAGFEPL